METCGPFFFPPSTKKFDNCWVDVKASERLDGMSCRIDGITDSHSPARVLHDNSSLEYRKRLHLRIFDSFF